MRAPMEGGERPTESEPLSPPLSPAPKSVVTRRRAVDGATTGDDGRDGDERGTAEGWRERRRAQRWTTARWRR